MFINFYTSNLTVLIMVDNYIHYFLYSRFFFLTMKRKRALLTCYYVLTLVYLLEKYYMHQDLFTSFSLIKMKRHFSWDILIYHNLAQTCYFLHIFPGIGKSLSEALIFASTNPQHDDRLFIELQVQYMKITISNLGRTCSSHVLQKKELLTKIYL